MTESRTRRPRMGEPRKTQQPLKIDRLPSAVHDAICELRNRAGYAWTRIEEQSGEKFNPDWQTKSGGFVDWDNLATDVLELFPNLRLPATNLQRWYDLRVAQTRAATMERAEHARVLAEAFAGSEVKGDKDAVLYAARDIFFGILSEDGSLAARAAAGKALLALAKEQQKSRTNDIRERLVATDERKIALLEEREKLAMRKLEAETDRLAKKIQSGEPITQDDLLQARLRTFGF